MAAKETNPRTEEDADLAISEGEEKDLSGIEKEDTKDKPEVEEFVIDVPE